MMYNGEDRERVEGVFSDAAHYYDRMNDVMSLGIHRLWKDAMVDALDFPRIGRDGAYRVIDVAGGTGDIAARILGRAGGGTQVALCDMNAEMLRLGRERMRGEGFNKDICPLVRADATHLPFSDHTFDAYMVAFGMRNMPDRPAALAEAYRILRPGGRFLCLEFGHVDMPIMRELYDFYSFVVIPAYGQVMSGDGSPWRYLVESIRRFPNSEDWAEMMAAAGFRRIVQRDMSWGVVVLHSAWKV